MSEGKSLHGDKSAWDTTDNAGEHAKDIDNSVLKHHLPAPGNDGNIAQDNGTQWVSVQNTSGSGHDHDGVYSGSDHDHDGVYSGSDHDHDDEYYTEAEVDALLDGKSGSDHDHDDEYYTESEVDDLLDGKSGSDHSHDLDDLNDVNAPAPDDGDVLTWSSGSSLWLPEEPTSGSSGGGASELDDLTDVNAPSPDDGDVLTWDDDAGEWTPEEPTSGSGGDGDSTYTDVYASRPAASNDGDLFLPSDGYVLERDTGAAWIPWGPIFPLGGVADAPTTWVNQNDSVATTGKGGVNIYDPVQGSSNENYGMLVKTAPSTPYTISALFLFTRPAALFQYHTPVLFGWRDLGDGYLSTMRIIYNANWKLTHLKATSPTNDVADYYVINFRMVDSLWFRIADDGTDLTQHISPDGQNWSQIHTIARGDWLTTNGPDQVLWGCSSRGTFIGGASTTLISWVEA